MSNTDNEIAVMTTTYGEVEVEFYPNVAPNHVKNWKKLAKEGFYNGTYFHRVIPGFMVQGGCPHTKDGNRELAGTGNAGSNIDAEFNETKHERGVLSMARSADPDSASCQFFIMVADSRHLDGEYSAFGKVISGMDVVDKIVAAEKDGRDNPHDNIFIESIEFKEA